MIHARLDSSIPARVLSSMKLMTRDSLDVARPLHCFLELVYGGDCRMEEDGMCEDRRGALGWWSVECR